MESVVSLQYKTLVASNGNLFGQDDCSRQFQNRVQGGREQTRVTVRTNDEEGKDRTSTIQ